MELFDFQKKILEKTKDKNKVAYYLDMGLGKTFVGSEKLISLQNGLALIICQKSKIEDWIKHFQDEVKIDSEFIFDLTDKRGYKEFISKKAGIGVINYELAFRRKELLKLQDFTLMLDESSMIQNDSAKRTKFSLKLQAENIILLSGTPTSGKYENLYSQCKLLGWDIPKKMFWNHYIETENVELQNGVVFKKVIGYKNVDRLKRKLAEHGAIFMKSEDAKLDLPDVTNITVNVNVIPEYKKFMKTSIVKIKDAELVGDNSLTKLLYARQLCGMFNKNKLDSFKDLIQSTNDRIIVFYNFTSELYAMEDICIELNKPISIVNGDEKDLRGFETFDNCVTLIQYRAGAMGLNLQKANKTIYFSLPLSSELFEQSKKRTHRIGQEKPCFYYYLICKDSVEEKILETLQMRKDYTDELFKKDYV